MLEQGLVFLPLMWMHGTVHTMQLLSLLSAGLYVSSESAAIGGTVHCANRTGSLSLGLIWLVARAIYPFALERTANLPVVFVSTLPCYGVLAYYAVQLTNLTKV